MTSYSYTGFHKPYFIVTWVEFSVSVLLLAARCYASLRIVKSSAPDIYLAILTFIFGAASMVVLTISAEAGLGIRGIVLNDTDQIDALLYGWLNQFLALIAIGLGKVTIVAFLQQIQGYHTVFRTVLLWLLAGSNLIVNFIAAALLITQCDPVQKLWDDPIPGSCPGRKRIQVFGYVQGTWSAFCDFALALFPVFLFAGIRAISVPTRIGLSILMGSGIIAGACTIVKTIKLSRLTTFTDATQQLQYVIVWYQSEMWVVFIASCLPPTKVFFTRMFKQATSFLRRDSDQDGS